MKIYKTCNACNTRKQITEFWSNKGMKDGFFNQCKVCALRLKKPSIKRHTLKCVTCGKEFKVLTSVLKKGQKNCSMRCRATYQKMTFPTGENSWSWKGNRATKYSLHDWVIKHLGRPKKCEICKTESAKKYEWSNKSQKYKRDLSDWQRLCTKCHMVYDRPYRLKKYRKWQKSQGMKLTPLKELNERYFNKLSK